MRTCRTTVRGQPGHVVAGIAHALAIGTHVTRDQVEQGGLACPVGADDARRFATGDEK
jgi:hypothetical protein